MNSSKKQKIYSGDYMKQIRKNTRWAKKHPVLSWFKGIKYWPYKAKRLLWEEPIRWTCFAWQRVFRGYDNSAIWGLNAYITNIALPVLKKYRKDGCGYPGEVSGLKEWNAILDKMIIAFTIMQKDEYSLDHKKWMKQWDKVDEGLALFAKYYPTLWD